MKPQFDHEKLHGYQQALAFVTWATQLCLRFSRRLQPRTSSIALPKAFRSTSLRKMAFAVREKEQDFIEIH